MHWLGVPPTLIVPLSASERQSGVVLKCSPTEKSVRWQRNGAIQLGGPITAVETKLDPIVEDAKFKGRVLILTHAITAALSGGMVLALRTIWPAHVPPPSILGK